MAGISIPGTGKKPPAPPKARPVVDPALAKQVLDVITRTTASDPRGCRWYDDLMKEVTGAVHPNTREQIDLEAKVDIAVNALMDEGLVYEPTLGRLKPVPEVRK